MPSIHTSVLDMACLASHGEPELRRVGAASARAGTLESVHLLRIINGPPIGCLVGL